MRAIRAYRRSRFGVPGAGNRTLHLLYKAIFERALDRAAFDALMALTDAGGVSRTFLASEESYRVVRQLHLDNRIVPLVGNFVGGAALRGIGNYLSSNN